MVEKNLNKLQDGKKRKKKVGVQHSRRGGGSGGGGGYKRTQKLAWRAFDRLAAPRCMSVSARKKQKFFPGLIGNDKWPRRTKYSSSTRRHSILLTRRALIFTPVCASVVNSVISKCRISRNKSFVTKVKKNKSGSNFFYFKSFFSTEGNRVKKKK